MNNLSSLTDCRANRIVVILIVLSGAVVCWYYNIYYSWDMQRNIDYQLHMYIVNKFYDQRKNWKTSNLGAIMFKNIDASVFRHPTRERRQYVVLVWRYWPKLNARHMRGYSKNIKDPLELCSVKNCIFSGKNAYLDTADAIVIHMQKGLYPKVKHRNQNQRWVFLSDESPIYSFTGVWRRMRSLANVFNWTMTYRSDSDVPVPYGRVVPLPHPIISVSGYRRNKGLLTNLIPNWNKKQRDVLVTILISHCIAKHRKKYLYDLREHIAIDIYGSCAADEKKTKCPGYYKSDCEIISHYLFYLAFENSMCQQYITEKLFYNAYTKGAVPIIMGAPLEDCEKLLPPDSFLHIDNYESPQDLAKDILRISDNYKVLLSYHKWRNHFQITNEHGYFGGRSLHYCRICEALNYNDGDVSIYSENDLKHFFDKYKTCSRPKFNYSRPC